MKTPLTVDPLAGPQHARHNGDVSPVRERTVADYMADQLARWGARFVFGLPGKDNLAFLDAVHRHPQLRFYGVRHETAAALMASAMAKVTGQIAVCTATSGPGIAGLINGLGDAYGDGAPVIAITGQVARPLMGTHSDQFVDQQTLLGPVTRQSHLLTHPDAIGHLLSGAMRTVLSQQTTAHISVPRDLWHETTAAPTPGSEPYLFTPRRSDYSVVQEAANLLNQAERPVIMAGAGCAHVIPQLLRVAERWRAPIIHSLPLAGKLPWQHPLSVGGLGEGGSETASRLLEEADWMLRIGVNWWPLHFVPRPGPAVVAIDVRPERIGVGSGADFGLVGDSGTLLGELESLLVPMERPAWEDRIRRLKAEWIDRLAQEAGADDGQADPFNPPYGRIHPARVMKELQDALPPDTIICLDVGDHVIWFNRHFQGTGQDIVFSGSWRTMGFSLPAALASKLAYPHRQVVAITGDGGLTMMLPELGTAVQHRIPVTIVLLRNDEYGTEAHQARLEGFDQVGTRLENPDFGQIVAAWGGAAYSVQRPDHIRPQLQAAIQSNQLALLDIPTAPVMPRTAERRVTQSAARAER